MNERIKELRKELKLTMEKFGERIGVSKATISNIENGNRNATDHMFKSICREFHVNEEWLRSGTGDMFSPVPNNTFDKLVEEFNLDSLEKAIIGEYLKLDVSHRSIIRDYILNIAQTKAALNAASGSVDEETDRTEHSPVAPVAPATVPDSVAAAESAYEKALGIVPRTDSTASNIIKDTGKNRQNKVG